MSLSPVGEARERVDGANWKPRERGTLCFIIENGKILLIEKKRGLGAGGWGRLAEYFLPVSAQKSRESEGWSREKGGGSVAPRKGGSDSGKDFA